MCHAIALCNNCLFHSLQDPFVEITMCCQFKLLSNTYLRTARQGVGPKRTWRLWLQSISHTHLSGQPVKTCTKRLCSQDFMPNCSHEHVTGGIFCIQREVAMEIPNFVIFLLVFWVLLLRQHRLE